MHYTCRHISVPKTSSFFTKHWEAEPDDSLIFSKRGHLFGLITLKADYSVNDISQIGTQIISYINELYFTPDGALFSAKLKFCLEQVAIKWSDYQPSILLVSINGQTMATSALGDAQLFIKRHQKYSQILESSSNQIQLITGPVSDNDLLFLTHPDIVNQIGNLSAFFNLDSLDSQEDFLTNTISPSTSSLLVQIHNFSTNSSSDIVNPSPLDIKQSPLVEPNHLEKAKLFSFLANLTKIFSKKSITINHQPLKHDQSKKKLNLVLGVLTTVALFISITIGTIKKDQKDRQSQFSSLENQVSSNFDTIDRIRSLDLDGAKNLAIDTQKLIDQMIALDIDTSKTTDLKSQVDQILAQTGSADHTTLEKVYGTNLIVNDPSYSKIIYKDNQFYLLDTKKGRLDSLTITASAKSNQQISQDSLSKNVKAINVFRQDIYALSNDSLYQVTKSNWPKLFSPPGDLLSVSSWGSSVYILSSDTILRSALVNNTLADPTIWLESDQTLPKDPVDLSIDSRIWVLSKTGQVNVYLRGKKDNFNLNSVADTSSASHLIVAQEKDLLLFLADSNTVLVYTKTGELISKYNFKDYHILSIALDEDSSTLFLLATDQNIYKLPL